MSSIDEEALDRLRWWIDHFAARSTRASERLATISDRHWYFAVLGLNMSLKEFDLGLLGKLQRVTEPPGEVELARALHDKSIFGAIGRYSHHIQYELAIKRDE